MCKYYTEKLRKANSTQEPRKFSFSENVDTEQDADVDSSVEQAFLDGVNGVVFDWNVDSVAEKGYNSERGENYVRTDEFRRLQEESKGESLGDSRRENYASNNGGLRGRLSAIFKGQLERCGINSGTNKLLRLTYDKHNTQFNIYEGVDGKLFHEVFEIARKYLKNGELVDLHGIETTEDGIGYNDCYNYLSEDGLSGFSITPDGDLISVFNASGKKGFLYSIAPIIKEKAKTLDCYASENQNLQEIYQKVFGFKTASVMDYNMEYDHDNIAENHGKPQVAFMVNTDAEVETKHFTKDRYDEAKEYRDGFVKSESADSSESASFMPENGNDHNDNSTSGKNGGDGEITVNMSESERAEILRNESVTPVEVGSEQSENFDFKELENNIKSKVEKALLKKFRELGLLKNYSSSAIGDIEFEFTAGGVRKSLNSQETLYGGTKADFAKAVVHLQELLDKAVLIETHTDKRKGTSKENSRLKQVYVMLSVMQDGNNVIPVQFEVKQYVDDNNRLYLAVALTKVETGVVDDTASKQMRTRLLPVSGISIPELFAKINPEDRNFLKYIPDEFLNDEQQQAKKRALDEDKVKYNGNVQLSDNRVAQKAQSVNSSSTQEIWEYTEKLKKAGSSTPPALF